ncbi:hypothetical protein Tco_1350981, partial [Tanacetum coccineum]
HVARERDPQRQVARDTTDLSLGNMANVKSPGNVSPSSFSVRIIPGDMSLGKRIPSDKSPGNQQICR